MAEARVTNHKSPFETPHLTMDEFMRAFSSQPVEVTNGELVEMMPPELLHALIAITLHNSLTAFVKGKKLGTVFMETPYTMEMDERRNWVLGAKVPDVSFVTRERLQAHLDRYGAHGPLRMAPDLAVEIVSPGDDRELVEAKLLYYLEKGVRLVWLIDPAKRSVRVITAENAEGEILADNDTLTGGQVIAGWSMSVAALIDPQID